MPSPTSFPSSFSTQGSYYDDDDYNNSSTVTDMVFTNIAAFVGIVMISAILDWSDVISRMNPWIADLAPAADKVVRSEVNAVSNCEDGIAETGVKSIPTTDRKISISEKMLNILAGYDHNYCDEFIESLLNMRCFYTEENSKRDFFFYMMNNNPLMGMVLATKGHPFSRDFRRMGFLFSQSLSFLFASIIAASGLDYVSNLCLNLFVFTPIIIIVSKVYYTLTVLSFYVKCACLGAFFRTTLIIASSILAVCSLIMYYVTHLVVMDVPKEKQILVDYLWQILVISNVIQSVLNGLNFVDHIYISIPGLSIGKWYLESLEKKQEKLDRDAGIPKVPTAAFSLINLLFCKHAEKRKTAATPNTFCCGFVKYILEDGFLIGECKDSPSTSVELTAGSNPLQAKNPAEVSL